MAIFAITTKAGTEATSATGAIGANAAIATGEEIATGIVGSCSTAIMTVIALAIAMTIGVSSHASAMIRAPGSGTMSAKAAAIGAHWKTTATGRSATEE